MTARIRPPDIIATYRHAGSLSAVAAELGVSVRTLERRIGSDSELRDAIAALRQETRTRPPEHGTFYGYRWQGCRCDECKRANTARQKANRERRTHGASTKPRKHGAAAYTNWNCRCDVCKADYAASHKPAAARYVAGHPAQMKKRAQRAAARRQSESLAWAHRHGYQWTGPEMEVVARDDLTRREMARMLGRSYAAVRTMRSALRRGVPRAEYLAGR